MAPDTPSMIAVSAPARRDPALDGLRGFSALLIFVFHYGSTLQSKNAVLHFLGYITQASWIGVVIFFALSGFLITGTIWDALGEKFLLRNFFIHRALRILPLYALALIISFLGLLARGLTWGSAKAFLIYVCCLQDFPYFRDIALRWNSPYPLYHLWSIAVEIQFYLLWPFLLLASDNRRSARNLCLRIFVISAFFRLIFAIPDLSFGKYNVYDDFFITHVGALALGSAVALALRSRDRSTGRIASPVRFLRRYAGYAFFSGLILFIGARLFTKSFLISDPLQLTLGLLGVSVAAAALVAIVLRSGRPRSFFSNVFLVGIGRISYGFYVFHLLLQPWFDSISLNLLRALNVSWSPDAYQATRLLIALPITILVATASYYLLERPCLRIAHRFAMPPALPGGLHLMHSSRRDPHRDTTPANAFVAVKIPADNSR